MKIAIIGAGNLGVSIAKGLIFSNAFTTLYLSKRKVEDIQDFEEYAKVHEVIRRANPIQRKMVRFQAYKNVTSDLGLRTL